MRLWEIFVYLRFAQYIGGSMEKKAKKEKKPKKAKKEPEKRSIPQNLKFVYQHMMQWHPESLGLVVINSLAVALAPFIWVIVPKLVIDELQAGANLKKILLILAITLVVSGVIHYAKEACVGLYRMKMSRIRMLFGLNLHEKAMKLEYQHVENATTQTLLNRATRNTSNPNSGVGGVMKYSFSIVGYAIGFLGYVGILVSLHPLVLVYLLFSVVIVGKLKQKSDQYAYSREDEMRTYGRKLFYLSRTMTDFEYGKDTRIYQLKDMLLKKMKGHTENSEAIRKCILKRRLSVSIIDAVLVLLRDGLVLGYMTYLAIQGNMSIGNFMFYVVAVSGFAQWMQELMGNYTELQLAARYVDEYRDFMDLEDAYIPQKPAALPTGKCLDIRFDNVDFAYPGTEKTVFNQLSLHIPPGQKLAVVGVNGAGKTSLIKLLTGLYRPTSGTISINGIDTNDIALTQLYTLFSVVFQEIKPFATSIAENIAGAEGVDNERVWDAISRAGLKDKVQSLERGIDTPLLKIIEDDGLELSGGENQKLALARALYKDGPIVILDEPTAALDPIAEKDIYESFSDMIDGRTAIFISHRLSSTKFCDQVAYFENGQIVEYGTHEALLSMEGKYAHMFNTQAQYYQDDTSERSA